VPDQDSVLPALERVMERIRIGDLRAEAVAAVLRHGRRGVAAHERRDRMEAGIREHGQQMPPGVGGIRETMQAEGERPGARLQDGEVDAVGLKLAALQHPHRRSRGRRFGLLRAL
jgi:hypothetical protein